MNETIGLNALAAQVHDNAVAHGFWDGPWNFGEQIALMHSELSEALEAHRAGMPDEYALHHPGCPNRLFIDDRGDSLFAAPSLRPATDGCIGCKPEGVAVELVDCLTRILDTLHARGADIEQIVARKMAYNAGRPAMHGKAY